MTFWSWLRGTAAGETPNATVSTPNSVGPGYNPGNPHGLVDDTRIQTFSRSLPGIQPSPWSGWPIEWATPEWGHSGLGKLVDIAWTCIDLNSSILSSMPTYRKRKGAILPPLPWMQNPNPEVYVSWQEFAKELFWEYMCGEAFVLGTEFDPFSPVPRPIQFQILPSDKVKFEGGVYKLGQAEIPAWQVLHIRYSTRPGKRQGIGPLEAAGARLTAAGVLQRRAADVGETGGVPPYVLEIKRALTMAESVEKIQQWQDARSRDPSAPAIVSGDTTAKSMVQPSPKDLALVELSQFTEARIAVELGVPPFLVGLPSGGDSLTYSNVTSLFDYHRRSSLHPKQHAVMSALSNWALPRGQSIELDLDTYSQPDFLQRTQAYVNLASIQPGPDGKRAIDVEEIRMLEGLHDDPNGPDVSATDGATPVTMEGGTGA